MLLGSVVAVALGYACDPTSPPPPDASLAAAELPRYWLQNATLFAEPKGKEKRHVRGPVLVELSPDGRVRSLPGAQDSIDGYLPEMLIFLPGEYDQGLLLYAQREAELRVDHPSGPRAGLLHTGAFVTVAPGDDTHALIGLPEFLDHGQPMVAFVERSALGAKPRKLAPPIRRGKGKSVLGYSFQLRLGEGDRTVSSLPCRDHWLDLGSFTASQFVGGVELRGPSIDPSGFAHHHPSRPYLSLGCPANVVFRIGSALHLPGLRETGAPKSIPIESTPERFRELTIPDPDPLAAAIEQDGTIWWLVDEEISATAVRVSCEPWTFDQSTPDDDGGGRRLEGRLVGPKPLRDHTNERKVLPHYPFTYDLSTSAAPARLHLGHIVPNQWRCLCDFDYALLGAAGDEMHVMARPITEQLAAYDPGEAERWFLTRSSCETARDQVVATLKREPAQATQIGFRAGPHPYSP